MTTHSIRRRTFVVTDVPEQRDVSPETSMHFLRTVDPARISDCRRLKQYVCQLQGCVKMLEEHMLLVQPSA